MKRLASFLLPIAIVLAASGCMITQSSTKIDRRADGSFSMVFPKNYKVDSLVVDPVNHVITIKGLTSDASGVIDSAGAANGKALEQMAATIQTLAPLAKAAAGVP